MRREKPSSRGLFFMMMLAGIALPLLLLPGVIFATQVSQLVWSLVFLDLVVVGILLQRQPMNWPVGWLDGLTAVVLVLLLATNLEKPLICAVILTFGLLFVFVRLSVSPRQFAFVLAGSALVTALIALIDFWSYEVGLIPLFSTADSKRLIGPFGQPNLFGCYLLVGLFAYLHVIYNQGRGRFLEFAPVVFIGAVIFLTASRAVSLALFLSLMITLWIVCRRGVLRQMLPFFLKTCVAFLLSYLLATGVFHPGKEVASNPVAKYGLGRSINQVATMQGDRSVYMRVNYWFTAILMAKDHPWSGVGIGAYKHNLGDYLLPAAESLHLTYDTLDQTFWPHNDFLQVLAESGLPVFLLVAFLFAAVALQAMKRCSSENLFLLAAFLSFCICMMLGHPLRYPATTFAFVLVASLVFPKGRRQLILSRKTLVACSVPVLLVLHLLFSGHVYDMYRLNHGLQVMVESKDNTVAEYSKVEQQWLSGSLDDDIHGWLFKELLLNQLTRKAYLSDDLELAAYVLPRSLEFREENRFHSFAFSISLLYFVLGDYEASRDFAREAFEKNPDKAVYFDLLHLNNAYIISRDNNRPIESLLSQKSMKLLKSEGVIRDRQMDDLGVVLPQSAFPETRSIRAGEI